MPKTTGTVKCKLLPSSASKGDRRDAHKAKMARKAEQRDRAYGKVQHHSPSPYERADYNPRTGRPHENLREKARARFAAGTVGRGQAYLDARDGKEMVMLSFGHMNTGKRHQRAAQRALAELSNSPF